MSTEKNEICGIDGQLKVTLKDLQSSISRLVKEKKVSEAASILWVASVTNNPDDPYYDYCAAGSILMGLEWIENGKVEHGTMRVEPPVIGSKYIN